MNHSSCKKPVDALRHIIKWMENGDINCIKAIMRDTPDEVQQRVDQADLAELNNLISSFSNLPEFQRYRLTERDVIVIAVLWQDYLDKQKHGLPLNEICQKTNLDIFDLNGCIDFFQSLMDRKVLRFNPRKRRVSKINPLNMLHHDYRLCQDFVMKIIDVDPVSYIERIIASKWNNDREFIADLKMTFDYFYSCYEEFRAASDLHIDELDSDIFYRTLDPLIQRLHQHDASLNIIRSFKKYGLDETEQYILIYMLFHHVAGTTCVQHDSILNTISRDRAEYHNNTKYLDNDSRLFRENILKRDEPAMTDEDPYPWMVLHDDYVSEIYASDEEEKIEKKEYSRYLKNTKAFEVIKTGQGIKDLIIPGSEKTILDSIMTKLKKPRLHNLSVWGLGLEGAVNPDRVNGFVALFHGCPGTGKTFAAGAIANELNKDLISVDCTRLTDCYYGRTEKLVRNAFRTMKSISGDVENPPVFLINEADQLMHSRTVDFTSSSVIENKIQNIILEELENFNGILILTTNLIQLIDGAYIRRINLKMRFDKPDHECRSKLWHLHLSSDIPGAQDIDIDYLSQRYEFTGGEIALVVQNACTEAIIRKGKARKLTLDDLIKYSNLELPRQNKKARGSIGF